MTFDGKCFKNTPQHGGSEMVSGLPCACLGLIWCDCRKKSIYPPMQCFFSPNAKNDHNLGWSKISNPKAWIWNPIKPCTHHSWGMAVSGSPHNKKPGVDLFLGSLRDVPLQAAAMGVFSRRTAITSWWEPHSFAASASGCRKSSVTG